MWYTRASTTTTPERRRNPMAKNEKAQEVQEEEGAVRIKPKLETYVNGVSGAGKKTKRADHPVSAALDGFTLDETYAVAAEMTDVPAKDLRSRYSHLNVGMQRMNLGNRIRGAVAKLDKAHEADSKVVAGLPTLDQLCAKPRAATATRVKAAAEAAQIKADAAKVKAAAKAKADAAKAKAATAESKAA